MHDLQEFDISYLKCELKFSYSMGIEMFLRITILKNFVKQKNQIFMMNLKKKKLTISISDSPKLMNTALFICICH